MKNVAVMIPCYRRPEFLQRCVAAVAEMPEVRQGVPVLLLADGGPESAQDQCVKTFLSAQIPNCSVVRRERRFRQPQNIILGKRDLFDGGYNYVALIEEDVVVHKYWLSLMLAIHAWANSHCGDCGIVGSSIVDNTDVQDWVSDGGHSLCNHLVSKQAWGRMWPLLQDYLEVAPTTEDLNDPRVIHAQRWINEQAASIEEGKAQIPHHWCGSPKAFYSSRAVPASQDAAHDVVLRVNGMSRLACDANRAIHIGCYGEHTTDALLYDKTLKGWDADACRSSFRLRPR